MLVGLWLSIGVVPLHGQLFPNLPFDSRQFTFEIVSQDHLRLTGEVELNGPNDEWQFFADQVDVLTDQQLLVAVGNVVYVAEGARLAADRAEVNINDLTGTFFNANGSVNMADEVERSMFGSQEPDMFFYGETIEKLGPRTYRLTRGSFTSCVQPTPRWEMSASSLTLNLDDYALMRNTVLEVKGVPVFYLPALYYPIQEDGRATGFLMPTYGASTYRGTSLSNAFFWAMGRSHDATFFHDWYTQTGQGQGAEYRYERGQGSQGNLRTYFLNEQETELEGSTLPARRSTEVRGDARHQITQNITARGNVNFFSDVTVQQTYHANVFEATNRQRTMSGNVSGVWGSYQLSGTFDANETFFGDRSATLWGGGPRVSFGQGQTEVPGLPFYYSFDAEYVRLLRRSTFNPGASDETQTDSGLHRFHVSPVLTIPFTRWPFLTVNTSLAFRSTHWTERIDPSTRDQLEEGISRNFFELQSQFTGPSFVKIWDTPDTGYSDRMKHVIEPFVTVRRLSQIDVFEEIVQLEGIDSIVGGVTQIQYGLNNRLYGRGGSFGDVAREILTVTLNQSYYTDDRAAQYDRRFSTSFNNTGRNNFSPLALSVRSAPDQLAERIPPHRVRLTLQGLPDLQRGGYLRAWRLDRHVVGVEPAPVHRAASRIQRPQLPRPLHQLVDQRPEPEQLGGRRLPVQLRHPARQLPAATRILVYYNAQCCGVSVEYQTFNFGGLFGRSRVPFAQDKRFNSRSRWPAWARLPTCSVRLVRVRTDGPGRTRVHGRSTERWSTPRYRSRPSPPMRIDGVKTKRLRLIPDERGWLMEILRSDDPEFFQKFGQAYVSATYPGAVKAWHYHKHQIDNFACIAGMVKLVLVDTREDSATKGHGQRVLSRHAATDDRAGAEPRLSRVEVREPGDIRRRQRADRALSVRRPRRVSPRATRHPSLRLDAKGWLTRSRACS